MIRQIALSFPALLLLLTSVVSAQGNRNVLPQAPPPFQGRVEETLKGAIPDYPQIPAPPADAPNILLILLDDVGFGMTSPFGGPVPTPNLAKLSANGLRYTRFHTTGLCSPTRAALLTGRNHHTVNTGVITEMATGFPGYTGIIPREAATIAQILQGNGYSTACFGKWHNTPEAEISPAGPFDRWPSGLGFGHFYGFNQGEANQYSPTLYRNTSPVPPPKSAAEGYHLTTDLTNEAIAWIHNTKAAKPNNPWFTYFAPGACHAPHHAPAEWREKFKGEFEFGWDRLRRLTFSRQRQQGIIPSDSVATLRPSEVASWDDLSADAKKVASRLMENYAAFMAHTDHEIGRLITSLEESGEIENTLILFVIGDNGASGEGGQEGTFNDLASLSGFNPGAAGVGDRIDQIGAPGSAPQIPVGWAWAMNTPFKWTKQIASHFGATRNPLIVHWPKGINTKGEIRTQFHHVIDITPTILDAAGITPPTEVNGAKQIPIEGVSMRYSFNDKTAKDQRKSQYFEIMGNRAMYHDGWIACARHGLPWETNGNHIRFDNDRWELYDLNKDFTQFNDVAARNPQKVDELKKLFTEEAKRCNIFPLDDRMTPRFDPRLRTKPPYRSTWTYYGNDISVPEAVGPFITPISHQMTINLTIPESGAEGVIACVGGESGGWSLFVKDRKLNYVYNFFGFETYTYESTSELPTGGPVTIVIDFNATNFNPSAAVTEGGVMTFKINDTPAGELTLTKSTYRHGLEPFEVGRDSITPVSPIYAESGAFPFTGTIQKIEFKVNVPQIF